MSSHRPGNRVDGLFKSNFSRAIQSVDMIELSS